MQKASAASNPIIVNSMASTIHFFVLNISRKAAQSGFRDQTSVMLPIQSVMSVLSCPRFLNIVAATQVIMT